MSDSCVKLLTDAKALVEKGWCQRAYARDEDDEIVDTGDPSAVHFCMQGALRHFRSSQEDKARFCLMCVSPEYSVSHWNDTPGRTLAEVLEIYDKAIALAIALA